MPLPTPSVEKKCEAQGVGQDLHTMAGRNAIQ
jgi:hypothetical protein